MITLNRARRAELIEDADFTLGRSRITDSAAMKDENVCEERPILLREQRHQLLLQLHRISFVAETQPETQTPNVGVDHHSLVLPECVAEDDVGGLAADSRQLHESFHRVGDFAVVPLDQSLAQTNQALRLVAEETGAPDYLLQFFPWSIGKSRGRRKGLEEQRRHHVYTLVGALGAQDRGNE